MSETTKVAAILAAGKGTRMKSNLPKVLHQAAGQSMFSWVVDAARQAGCSRIIGIVGHKADEVRQSMAGQEDIVWVEQTEQLGTGHALAQVAPHVQEGETVLVLSGDVPLVRPETLEDLTNAAEASGWGSMAVAEMEDPAALGRVLATENGSLDRIVEASDASEEELAVKIINAGIYALPHEIFDFLSRLDNKNAKGEYYLTDALGDAAAAGRSIGLVHLADPEEASGVNDRRNLAIVHKALLRRRADELMQSGVTILDPDRTVIQKSVEVGADTVIHPDVTLLGNTRIGSGCELHQGAWIRNATLAENVVIHPYSILEGAQVNNDCQVGPYGRLRPATVMEEGSRVGNFVELKKTRLGRGSKASHLAYLGDATLGENVNIGAGTITCNYDGANKHATKIDDEAFIGSDTMLVAPVHVGRRATTGAGSTVTEDVPEEALAVGRAKQRNIDGYYAKRPKKKPKK